MPEGSIPGAQPTREGNGRARQASADVELEPRKRELPRDLVDDVHLAGIEAGRQAAGGHLELEHRRVAIGRVDLRTLDRPASRTP